jgi:chaperonin cofactor prefoldin
MKQKKTEIMKEVKKKIAEDLAGKIKINEAKIKKLSYRLENLKKTIEFYKEHKDAAVDKTFQSLIKAAGITKNK